MEIQPQRNACRGCGSFQHGKTGSGDRPRMWQHFIFHLNVKFAIIYIFQFKKIDNKGYSP